MSAAAATVAPAKLEQQQQQEAVSARVQVKFEDGSITPVEVMAGPCGKARQVGEIAIAQFQSHEELWRAIRSSFAAHIPGGSKARLVYQDAEGDWLLLQPNGPWHYFCGSIKRLLVACD